ncbi:MAG TPA: hypothetical protein VI136_00970 [Verrucomicrobiae bacterium]
MRLFPASISPGRAVRRRELTALSLIEVMIAMALFFMVVFAILGMVSSTLRNARRLQAEYVDAGAVATHLCLSNRLEEGSFDFDFGDLYPDYRGMYEVTPITNGLFRVDILVENERQRGAAPSTMTIMLFRPDSPAGPGIGFR